MEKQLIKKMYGLIIDLQSLITSEDAIAISLRERLKEIASLEQIAEGKPEMFIAKSGRKYRHIPDDMDIETWDVMTPLQRLEYKGLLKNAPVFTGKEIPAGAETKTINEILKPLVFDDSTLLDSVGELDFVSRNDAARAMEEYATLKVKEAQSASKIETEGKEKIMDMIEDLPYQMDDFNEKWYTREQIWEILSKVKNQSLQKEPTLLRDELIKFLVWLNPMDNMDDEKDKIVDNYLNKP